MKYLDENGLLYLVQKIKTWLGGKANSSHTHAKADITDYTDYTLPTASSSVKGGIKIGAGLTMTGDVLSATGGGTSYSIVAELPEIGDAGVIYLISNSGTIPNIYDEYIYVNNGFEKIGTTAVDLTDYVQSTDLVAITNAEIDTICT